MEGGRSDEQETAAAARAPPALPWTVRLKLYFLVAFGTLAMRPNGKLNRRFFSIADRKAPTKDEDGVRSADVTVDASRELWFRVFSPSQPQALPVVVYFHGGAFATLSPSSASCDDMCRRFCRDLGAVVLSVNYRLAPEHRCPAAYDDGLDVLRYLDSNDRPDLGVPVDVDLSRCFLAGDSAGGNIAHHVAKRWTSPPTCSKDNPIRLRLAGIILVQPYFGGEERTRSEVELEGKAWVVNMKSSDWAWKAFLPEGADRDHPAAHVTEDNADLPDGFPPALVVVGGLDPSQDWQRGYVQVLRASGKAAELVEFEHAIHAFFYFPELPDTANLSTRMKAFMDSRA